MFNDNQNVSDQGCLTRSELAEHLAIDRGSLPRVLESVGLEPLHGRFPWRRVWICIHNLDGNQIGMQLESVRLRLGLKMSTQELLQQMKQPLIGLDQVALRMGYRTDTLAKAVRQGRVVIPVQAITLGPRLKRFRPLEIDLWREQNVFIDLPIFASPLMASKAVAHPSPAETLGATAQAKSPIFGVYARSR